MIAEPPQPAPPPHPPDQPVRRGLLARFGSNALRRRRLPRWLRIKFWPLYVIVLVTLLGVGLTQGVFAGLMTGAALAVAYLLGMLLPYRIVVGAFHLVTRPVVGVVATQVTARALWRQGIPRATRGLTKGVWRDRRERTSLTVSATHEGVSFEGLFSLPKRAGTFEHSFRLEDRVSTMPETWRRTGDPVFERAVEVADGRDSVLLPALLLSPARRDAIVRFLTVGARYGRYRCEVDGVALRARVSWWRGVRAIRRTVDEMQRGLTALCMDGELPDILAEGADAGDFSRLREWCLGVTLQHFWHHPQAAPLAEAGLSHPEPAVRLRACLVGEHRGDPLLGALLAISGPDVDREPWGDLIDEAVRFAVGSDGEGEPAFARALVSQLPPEGVRYALLGALGERQYGLELLGELAANPEEPMRERVFRVLEEFGDARVEDALLTGLHGPVALQLIAISALRRLGTVRCVAPLLPLRDRLFGDGQVRRAARATIEEVQNRLRGASAGQLSLATKADQVGRVSLASPGRSGGLSEPMDSDDM